MNDERLIDLAEACNGGACNAYALIQALARSAEEVGVSVREHPALPIVLGHICYLIGEGIGPSLDAANKYETFLAGRAGAPA